MARSFGRQGGMVCSEECGLKITFTSLGRYCMADYSHSQALSAAGLHTGWVRPLLPPELKNYDVIITLKRLEELCSQLDQIQSSGS